MLSSFTKHLQIKDWVIAKHVLCSYDQGDSNLFLSSCHRLIAFDFFISSKCKQRVLLGSHQNKQTKHEIGEYDIDHKTRMLIELQ